MYTLLITFPNDRPYGCHRITKERLLEEIAATLEVSDVTSGVEFRVTEVA